MPDNQEEIIKLAKKLFDAIAKVFNDFLLSDPNLSAKEVVFATATAIYNIFNPQDDKELECLCTTALVEYLSIMHIEMHKERDEQAKRATLN